MKILELLNYWDTSSYDFTIQCEHENVVNAIMKKLQSMDLRQAYSKLIYDSGVKSITANEVRINHDSSGGCGDYASLGAPYRLSDTRNISIPRKALTHRRPF